MRVVRLGAPLADDLAYERRVLDPVGAELVQVQVTTEAEAIEAARDADVVMNAGYRVARELIASLRRCRGIVQCSIGYDRVDVVAATERNIVVANLHAYCIEEVSDHAVALMLACARRLLPMDRAVRDGTWQRGYYDGRQAIGEVRRLRGQTCGIVGLGNIGRLVARKVAGLGFRLLGYDPYVRAEVAEPLGVRLVGLDELLRESDLVTLHVPLMVETCHLIGSAQFAAMKPTAYLVNTCRGPVVDEPALVAALRDGRIAGAGLDVFETEPLPLDSPLVGTANVVLTPHHAVYSQESMIAWRHHAVDEAARILGGRWPRGLVNRELRSRLTLEEPD
ncbi:MAG: C-terminal binding protein [Chloroflexi bacterium]|nr:C-terminal binding protein [Chloroflexota bacterium]